MIPSIFFPFLVSLFIKNWQRPFDSLISFFSLRIISYHHVICLHVCHITKKNLALAFKTQSQNASIKVTRTMMNLNLSTKNFARTSQEFKNQQCALGFREKGQPSDLDLIPPKSPQSYRIVIHPNMRTKEQKTQVLGHAHLGPTICPAQLASLCWHWPPCPKFGLGDDTDITYYKLILPRLILK